MNPLVIDVGGSHVKLCVRNKVPIQFDSGKHLSPSKMVREVQRRTSTWKYDRVSIGIPARIDSLGQVVSEPGNLGKGWKRFDYRKAFGKPVRILNDAALQALGAYDGGRMLFLGFGTGVGSVLISQSVIMPLELGELKLNRTLLWHRLGKKAFEKNGPKRWRRDVIEIAKMLMVPFSADYVVLGGGKAGEGLLDPLPAGLRRGGNEDAFTGGFRLWEEVVEPHDRKPSKAWRVLG